MAVESGTVQVGGVHEHVASLASQQRRPKKGINRSPAGARGPAVTPVRADGAGRRSRRRRPRASDIPSRRPSSGRIRAEPSGDAEIRI